MTNIVHGRGEFLLTVFSFCSSMFILAFSYDAPVVALREFLPTIPEDYSICVAIGAMAHGEDNFADSYVDKKIGVSGYPLSASVACGKLCCGVEDLWNII